MDAQLRKGLLEFCVLAVLEKQDSYGYKIIKDISTHVEISESTLYPILRRMEKAGNVTSYTEEYNHRLRKYFHLSDEGQIYLNAFRHERQQIVKILDFIGKRVEENEEAVFKGIEP
ncbi:MAG: PadR family transcriptional regulator [Clostridiales bacterium]|nr:PadR family transcriptional regulator [Clostridiales bacterium]